MIDKIRELLFKEKYTTIRAIHTINRALPSKEKPHHGQKPSDSNKR